MSTSPAATNAALPLDEPPVVRVRSYGLRTGPVSLVWLPPEKHRLSQTALPRMVPPASRMRVTMVASTSGTYPSSVTVPFIIGTPATQTLSLIATVLPASGPLGAPEIWDFQYQAPSGLSSADGRYPGSRGYLTGRLGSTNSSRRAYEPSVCPIRARNVSSRSDVMSKS